ncbi:MAG TPA: HD domain-containing protein [Anaerolineales bacterium]|nr:HD domain-containing protein [Anaerolineales bacterium]
MPDLSPRMYQALDLAFRLHGHAARKGLRIPVMGHLLGVCALVKEDGGSEDEAIAALLHDALEDAPEQITREQIEKRFGPDVLRIIEASTDTPRDFKGGPKPPWSDRKNAYLARARSTDPSLLRVTVADKIDNLRSLLADYKRSGDKIWGQFHAGKTEQAWYYRSCLEAYTAAGFKGPLLEELRALVGELTRLTAA